MPTGILSSASAEVAEPPAEERWRSQSPLLGEQLNLPDCCDPDILRVSRIRHSLLPPRMQPGPSQSPIEAGQTTARALDGLPERTRNRRCHGLDCDYRVCCWLERCCPFNSAVRLAISFAGRLLFWESIRLRRIDAPCG